MSAETKTDRVAAGDWCEYNGERLLVWSGGGGSVWTINRDGKLDTHHAPWLKRLPDCTGWDWEPEPSLQLREGAWYEQRDGEVAGPVVRCAGSIYPWKACSNSITYTDSGRSLTSRESSYDLIREVPAPTPKCRPFANDLEFAPHRERWVRWKQDKGTKNEAARHCITSYSDNVVWIGGASQGLHYSGAFNRIELEDGTPFGVKE